MLTQNAAHRETVQSFRDAGINPATLPRGIATEWRPGSFSSGTRRNAPRRHTQTGSGSYRLTSSPIHPAHANRPVYHTLASRTSHDARVGGETRSGLTATDRAPSHMPGHQGPTYSLGGTNTAPQQLQPRHNTAHTAEKHTPNPHPQDQASHLIPSLAATNTLRKGAPEPF